MPRRGLALLVVAVAVAWTFQPVAGFAFLNWDDQSVILQNPSLDFPGVVGWAFTTTYMEHYQPLSWLVWAAIKHVSGLDAAAFHVANLVAHGLATLLVFGVARRVLTLAAPVVSGGSHSMAAVAAALAAALLFGLHPLRVEVVAWVSALPYSLALALLLASLLAYLHAPSPKPQATSPWPQAPGRASVFSAWWTGALALYAASLLARPVGLGFPIVLFVLDTSLLRRTPRARAARLWPFAALAIAFAGVESAARVAGLNDTPGLYRVQSVATAPFVYLWHTVAPVALTPLDALPLQPVASPGLVAVALLALAGASAAAWWQRGQWPAAAAAWAAYLALLVPAAGLVPSGLQATADRYAYLPGVVIAIALAGAGARWAAAREGRQRFVAAACVVLTVASAVVARRALGPWADSITLWTRVVSLDPAGDVGLYNLGTALTAAGRAEDAAARYRELLELQPAHVEARANLDRLDAARLEREGNDLAAQGHLAAAAVRYGQATSLDPKRTHSHAGRGMALASLGRTAEALTSLREALRQGETDPSVPGALAVLLLQSGEKQEARTVLEAALAMHQDDVGLAHNLARLLATSPDSAEDAGLALQLASAVVEATGDRDPRAIETLATALAANSRLVEASAANARAAALATAQGNADLAVQITARGREYRRPGQ